MPFINSKVSTKVSKEQEQEIKTMLAQAAGEVLGKGENWLMVGIEPECTLYFRGDDSQPSAFVDVSIYGGENKQAFSTFTGRVCDIMKQVLNISPDRVYVKYYATSNWGWNGSNF
ncbi:MAG: phenylpyruvate tautomerase MIF-related protein [Clostridium sp.]|nr:phenylpyruvate tautomerase MIF-related protein [Clostridium sp.]MCM1398757.1 phenylpyruvate tautomerase MIF-related protein [Clostridium sp.]MCM1458611.1 phenylpyruvate tautomerase MIF-related protein [Bacteroides sp.]